MSTNENTYKFIEVSIRENGTGDANEETTPEPEGYFKTSNDKTRFISYKPKLRDAHLTIGFAFPIRKVGNQVVVDYEACSIYQLRFRKTAIGVEHFDKLNEFLEKYGISIHKEAKENVEKMCKNGIIKVPETEERNCISYIDVKLRFDKLQFSFCDVYGLRGSEPFDVEEDEVEKWLELSTISEDYVRNNASDQIWDYVKTYHNFYIIQLFCYKLFDFDLCLMFRSNECNQ